VLYWAPLAAMFHGVALPLGTLLALIGVASAVLWLEEARKFRVRGRLALRQCAQPRSA